MFGALLGAEDTAPGVAAEIAREFSPRIEGWSHAEVVLDLSGLARLFGDARTIAEELRRTAADRGVRVRVAIAGTRTAARLCVRHRAGLTIIEPGTEAAALASLPITLLGELPALPYSTDRGHEINEPRTSMSSSGSRIPDPGSRRLRAKRSGEPRRSRAEAGEDLLTTLRRWGLKTLGDLAALPADEIAARLGRDGVTWQQLSRGVDVQPLVPAVPEERFEQTLDLEWPIEDLEPLSFVLGRLMEPLASHLEQRDRAAAILHVRLHLIKTAGPARDVHERSLQLPFPIRDARTLRTLALLDLESNPPAAPIDRVTVAVDPTPARILQFSLLTRPLPSPEQISTLLARLHALMGETRCGSPVMVDLWAPGVFAMKPFNPGSGIRDSGSGSRIPDPGPPVSVALRRFRHPLPIRVHVSNGKPSSVITTQRGVTGGGVASCAGPWRTSGNWWHSGSGTRDSRTPKDELADPGSRIPDPGSRVPGPGPWDRDEWDVALTDGPTYRVFRERGTNKWFLEGVMD